MRPALKLIGGFFAVIVGIIVAGFLFEVAGLGGDDDGDDGTSTSGPTWTTVVANNIGDPNDVAEAYALSQSHGQRGPVYRAALGGCRRGQNTPGGPGNSFAIVPDLPARLAAVWTRAFRFCGDALDDQP